MTSAILLNSLDLSFFIINESLIKSDSLVCPSLLYFSLVLILCITLSWVNSSAFCLCSYIAKVLLSLFMSCKEENTWELIAFSKMEI